MSGLRLGAVALMVPDYESGIAFYVRGLGFDLVEDIDQGRKRWVTVRAGPDDPRIVLAVGRDAPHERVAYFLESSDFAASRSRIEAAGGVFEEEPRSEPYGTVAVWRDPFGNRWDLIEPT